MDSIKFRYNANDLCTKQIALTKEQTQFLKSEYNLGYRFIVRGANGNLYAFKEKPKKGFGGELYPTWGAKNELSTLLLLDNVNNECFPFIKRSDIEPWEIEKILNKVV